MTVIINKPVLINYGKIDSHLYDKKSLNKWLKSNNTSPLTKEPVKKMAESKCYELIYSIFLILTIIHKFF